MSRNHTPLWNEFFKAIKHEVVPALGCTEPISVALACAVATSHLDENQQHNIKQINVKVSPNLMKNGMGVTVPGTGVAGLPIAAAVGALGGDAKAGLEVLHSLTENQVNLAKMMIEDGKVVVTIADRPDALYVDATIASEDDCVIRVCICDTHTNIISIEKNGEAILKSENASNTLQSDAYSLEQATAKAIYDFASEVPFEQIKFILKAAELNDALSNEGLKNNYGLHIGVTLKKQIERGFLADDLLSKILIRSSAASDARMGGATLPAMSNSGSGNQGIAATMPVIVVAEYIEASEEQLARALILSHLMAIYIHSKFPKLSALCAVITASMGAAAGMGWLLSKGEYEPISMAICSMVGDLSGMICDGASNSCTMKVSTAVSSAFKAVLLALENKRVEGTDGIVCHDVDQSIASLGALASKSMQETDKQIIDIMMNKSNKT